MEKLNLVRELGWEAGDPGKKPDRLAWVSMIDYPCLKSTLSHRHSLGDLGPVTPSFTPDYLIGQTLEVGGGDWRRIIYINQSS